MKPKVRLSFPQIMVTKMGNIVEACEPGLGPLPCFAAVCYCYSGGVVGAGAGLGTQDADCITYIEPCTDGDELCSQCYSEHGCPDGRGHVGETTCERKGGNGPIVCRPGGRDQG